MWSIRMGEEPTTAKNKEDRKSQKGGIQGAQGISRVVVIGSPSTNLYSSKEYRLAGIREPGAQEAVSQKRKQNLLIIK